MKLTRHDAYAPMLAIGGALWTWGPAPSPALAAFLFFIAGVHAGLSIAARL